MSPSEVDWNQSEIGWIVVNGCDSCVDCSSVLSTEVGVDMSESGSVWSTDGLGLEAGGTGMGEEVGSLAVGRKIVSMGGLLELVSWIVMIEGIGV